MVHDFTNTRHPVDTLELPQWGTGPDGNFVRLEGDERLPALFELWRNDACDHPETAIVRWTNAGGHIVYKRYCTHCGTAVSSFIKTDIALKQGVSDLDKDRMASLSASYYERRKAQLDKLVSDAAERTQPGNRSQYDDYLRSDAWKRKVAAIMKRAGGTCEGCLTRSATQVHHLTYAHMFNEFAFELVALCGPCHGRIHKTQES